MKKLLVLAALSAVFSASAVDQYFYWMVDSGATVSDPRTGASKAVDSTGYATIKLADGGTYLNFYDSPGGEPYGDYYASFVGGNSATPFSKGVDGATFAGIIDSAMSSEAKFILELYSEEGEWIGQNEFSYGQILSYLTEGGMSTPVSAKAFNAFYAVPEPTSGLLLLLGVAGLALRRRRLQKA